MFKHLFLLLFFAQVAQAQMIDLRNLSNKRFAENPHGVAVDRTPKYQRRQEIKKKFKQEQEKSDEKTEEELIAENEKKVQKEDKNSFNLKTPNTERSIRQTGINIFQPKDEQKIFDSNIETPEYDALRTYQKRDVQNRIHIDE